jgi:hypothetical protein
VDGDAVVVRIAIAGNAALGEHVVLLDDGERLWTARFEVDERVIDSGRCTTAPGSLAGAIAALLLAVRRRRR